MPAATPAIRHQGHQSFPWRVRTPSGEDYEALANAIEKASDRDVAVVAAAGNDDGGPVEYPAAYPSVLSVGADDTQGGALCSFSSRGEGLRLTAPGCDLDGADPNDGEPDYNYWQGTSESSVIAAAALTALESYRPELSFQAAEEDLTGANGGALDIAQTFRDEGLGSIVTAGEATDPGPPVESPNAAASPQSVAPSISMTLSLHSSAREHASRESRSGSCSHWRVAQRSPAEVRYLGHRRHSRRSASFAHSTAHSRISRCPSRVSSRSPCGTPTHMTCSAQAHGQP